MNEDRFLYYVTICNEGSLTKASEKLYISQPSLTKYINSLEKELGIKLMERTCSPIRLTEAGNLYLEYAKDALERYKKLKDYINTLNEKRNNTIVFGISSNLSKYFLNDVVTIAQKINPDFDFKIIEETSYKMEGLIKSGDIDVAFLNTENLCSEDINYTVIKEDRICLVCDKRNPVLQNKDINDMNEYVFKKEDIREISLYLRDEEFQLTKVVNNYLHRKGLKAKNIIHVTDLNIILYLLCNTNRFAFVPEFFLNESEFKDQIAVCNIENDNIKWYMTLSYSKKSKFSRNVKEWIQNVETFYEQKNN